MYTIQNAAVLNVFTGHPISPCQARSHIFSFDIKTATQLQLIISALYMYHTSVVELIKYDSVHNGWLY